MMLFHICPLHLFRPFTSEIVHSVVMYFFFISYLIVMVLITTDGIIVGTALYFSYERDIKSWPSGIMLISQIFLHNPSGSVLQFQKTDCVYVYFSLVPEKSHVYRMLCGLKLK